MDEDFNTSNDYSTYLVTLLLPQGLLIPARLRVLEQPLRQGWLQCQVLRAVMVPSLLLKDVFIVREQNPEVLDEWDLQVDHAENGEEQLG